MPNSPPLTALIIASIIIVATMSVALWSISNIVDKILSHCIYLSKKTRSIIIQGSAHSIYNKLIQAIHITVLTRLLKVTMQQKVEVAMIARNSSLTRPYLAIITLIIKILQIWSLGGKTSVEYAKMKRVATFHRRLRCLIGQTSKNLLDLAAIRVTLILSKLMTTV